MNNEIFDNSAWENDYDDSHGDTFTDNEAESAEDDMDGDWDSGMASAGWGTDEDYGYFGNDEDF
jgi:hypothetical protein